MRASPLRLAPLLLLALGACANETSIPQATDAPTPRNASAPPPAGPVTEYDGRYAGTVSLNPDRTRTCPAGPAGQRELVVRQGRASLLLNPQTRQTLTGTVGAEGSVRMADSLDRNIATSGVFSPQGFLGEHRYGLCTYAVQMPKRS
ncbi:hypothetical protein GCM10011504_39060 [Siccirubricoccus deserti]|nr:hypothetical protein GCM10011504_39060 [Siccirubricoccus deserti]